MFEFFQQYAELYGRDSGGWIYFALGLLGVFLYTFAFSLWVEVRRHPLAHQRVSEWTEQAILFVRAEGTTRVRIRARFQLLRDEVFLRFDRRLRYVTVLVSAAPLLGLLGTILGMTETFAVLAQGGSGILDRMAEGIGVALISTQLGLVLALPGTLLAVAIRRQCDRLQANLALLETSIIGQALGRKEATG